MDAVDQFSLRVFLQVISQGRVLVPACIAMSSFFLVPAGGARFLAIGAGMFLASVMVVAFDLLLNGKRHAEDVLELDKQKKVYSRHSKVYPTSLRYEREGHGLEMELLARINQSYSIAREFHRNRPDSHVHDVLFDNIGEMFDALFHHIEVCTSIHSAFLKIGSTKVGKKYAESRSELLERIGSSVDSFEQYVVDSQMIGVGISGGQESLREIELALRNQLDLARDLESGISGDDYSKYDLQD